MIVECDTIDTKENNQCVCYMSDVLKDQQYLPLSCHRAHKPVQQVNTGGTHFLFFQQQHTLLGPT